MYTTLIRHWLWSGVPTGGSMWDSDVSTPVDGSWGLAPSPTSKRLLGPVTFKCSCCTLSSGFAVSVPLCMEEHFQPGIGTGTDRENMKGILIYEHSFSLHKEERSSGTGRPLSCLWGRRKYEQEKKEWGRSRQDMAKNQTNRKEKHHNFCFYIPYKGKSFLKQIVSQRKVTGSDIRKKRSPPYYLLHLNWVHTIPIGT